MSLSFRIARGECHLTSLMISHDKAARHFLVYVAIWLCYATIFKYKEECIYDHIHHCGVGYFGVHGNPKSCPKLPV